MIPVYSVHYLETHAKLNFSFINYIGIFFLFEKVRYAKFPNGEAMTIDYFMQAKEILANWGLQIDPQMIRWEGRRLPLEKVYFGKTTILAGEEADWGRDAVKQQLISTVS